MRRNRSFLSPERLAVPRRVRAEILLARTAGALIAGPGSPSVRSSMITGPRLRFVS
jgi:hypothetical protein